MKWFLVLLELGIFFSGYCQDSVLKNGNFEDGLHYWSFSEAYLGKINVIDHDFYDGKKVLKIEKDSEIAAPIVSQNIKILPKTDYILTGYVKTTFRTEKSGALVTIIGSNGQVISQNGTLGTNEIWEKFSIPFTSNENPLITLQLAISGKKGIVLFDGLSLNPTKDAGIKEMPNIALGCTYKFNKETNYANCKDPEDMKQLTDGKHTSGHFWTQKTTVGWTQSSIEITVDLGKNLPIGGIKLGSVGGAANVTFLKNIFVLVSTDGKNFYFIDDLVHKTKGSPDPDEIGYKTFTYNSLDFKTHGRYVRFICITPGRYLFIDEIEIYLGKKESLLIPYTGRSFKDGEIPVKELTEGCCRERFLKDISNVDKYLDSANVSNEFRNGIKQNLDKLKLAAQNFTLKGNPDHFKAIVPYNKIHKDIFSEFSKILTAQGVKPLTVWHSYHYAPLSLFEYPGNKSVSFNMKMMQNEYRSEAFNITNASGKEEKIIIFLEGIPKCIDLKKVEYVDTAQMNIVATALIPLVEQKGIYELNVPDGMTYQIWITFNSKNIPSGAYRGFIKLTGDNFKESISLSLDISKLHFPDKPSLNAGVFDYAIDFSFGITEKNRKTVINDLKQHFINVPFAAIKEAAWPSSDYFTANGILKKKLDFSNFEKYLEIWPDAKNYCIFLELNTKSKFAGFKRETATFKTAVGEWAKAWNEYIVSKQITKNKIWMHFIDEPRTPEMLIAVNEWFSCFNSKNEMINIVYNPRDIEKTENTKLISNTITEVNTILLNLPEYIINYNSEIQELLRHKNFNIFQCAGPNRNYDPAYFRIQPWYCFIFGAKGSFFWAYSDFCGNPWNEYTSISGYTFALVYLDDNGPTATKHWEAFREGIEDYEYLKMLKEEFLTLPLKLQKEFLSYLPSNNESNEIGYILAKDTVERMALFKDGKRDFEWKGACKYADENRLYILKLIEKISELKKNAK